MRVESVLLKVAGIGAVTTRESFRKRGLMAEAARDSFKAMKERGYHLSILRGRHYVKFGYARAWNYVTYKLSPEDIPVFEIKYPYQSIDQTYFDKIISLYNQTHAGFTGTALRPTYRTINQEGDGPFWGWFDGHMELAGYLRAIPTDDKTALQCLEAAGDPYQVLAVLKALFNKGDYKTINFFTLPCKHPVLQILRKGACVLEDRFFQNTGWRVKIINLPTTLEVLKPLLVERLRNSHMLDWHGQLHIDAGDHQANLSFHLGDIEVMSPSFSDHEVQGGPAIGRFLIGSDEPDEITKQEGIAYTGVAEDLVRVLFPNLHPILSHWDEF